MSNDTPLYIAVRNAVRADPTLIGDGHIDGIMRRLNTHGIYGNREYIATALRKFGYKIRGSRTNRRTPKREVI